MANALKNNFKDNSIEIFAPQRPKSAHRPERTEEEVEQELFGEVEEIDYGDQALPQYEKPIDQKQYKSDIEEP